ncbi:hypothetical protein [Halosolutus gelatinilyticus]|uniref:hypothetical protein n=1 Tax=Halosolutus gelatinilyticus TaxID=2931975 RepID=UPI001FF569DE|nr:hypothetical protein [Halosolutus gelatinilyticus]
MVGFGVRFSILAGGATTVAIVTVLIASGTVALGTGERWVSNALLGVALFALALLVAMWYEPAETDE